MDKAIIEIKCKKDGDIQVHMDGDENMMYIAVATFLSKDERFRNVFKTGYFLYMNNPELFENSQLAPRIRPWNVLKKLINSINVKST